MIIKIYHQILKRIKLVMKKLKKFEDYTYRGENPEKLASYGFINKVKALLEYFIKDKEKFERIYKSTVFLNIVSERGPLVFTCYYSKPRSNWDRKLTKVREVVFGTTEEDIDLKELQDYLDYEVGKHFNVQRVDNPVGVSVSQFDVSETDKLFNIDVSIGNYEVFKQRLRKIKINNDNKI